MLLSESIDRLRAAIDAAQAGLVDRKLLVELCVLGAVAGEHVLLIGPPGTAKSEAARRISRALGGNYFEYLLGRFTEPNELFGGIDLQKLRAGRVETDTTGMLPEAEIAFLDEVFLGSSAILNTLLSLLNERRFKRGHTVVDSPLKLCIGAANHLPEDPALAAFSDRFLVRTFVRPTLDSDLEALLASAATKDRTLAGPVAEVKDLAAAGEAAKAVDLSAARPLIAEAARLLRKEGIALSDRRLVRAQRLVAAAAALSGRVAASAADVWPLVFVVPTEAEQATAQRVLEKLLAMSDHPLLVESAHFASESLKVLARKIEHAAADVLVARPQDPATLGPWRLRVEGVLREIDANFAKDALPEPLAKSRAQLAAVIDPPPPAS